MKKLSTPRFMAVAWLLFLAGIIHTQAQQIPKIAPYGRGYLEYLPPGYAASTELYPCIIFLHGSGERGLGTLASLPKVANNGPAKHIKNGHTMCFTVNGKTECFIVLSPQTNKWSWKDDVVPFVKYALQTYRIDPDRVYLTGLSMGGEGTWFGACFADNEPNLYAAMGIMCGRASRTDGCNVQNKKISVWAFHGDADTAIPINGGFNPILGMRSCGGNPIWTVYAGVSHGGCWDRGYRTDHLYHNPNLYEWFLGIKRNNPGPQPPNVNAGIDITITLPVSTATLIGTAADPDGTISSTVWQQVNGPNVAGIVSPNALTTVLNGLVAGTYTFSLTATDNSAMTGTDQVVVKVNPAPPRFPPVANAGTDKEITAPASSIALTGSGTDSDGTISSYLWKQDSGPNTATLAGSATTTLNASNLIVGTYTFSLTVTDNNGLTGADQVIVRVLPTPPNAAPVADAGIDKEITLPVNQVNLAGAGTDPDGTIVSYAWSQSSGPTTATISPLNQGPTLVSNLAEGVYVFTLLVTDNRGSTDNDQVIVTVLPVPPNSLPVANAGLDINITLPVSNTTLTGSGTDSDGTIATYAWTQTSGPSTVAPQTPASSTTNLAGLIEGNYVYTLTVTDNRGGQGADQVMVKVNPPPPNQPPVADAGTNVDITLPVSTASLNGAGTDSDGTIAVYKWTQQSGPSTATITTDNLEDTQVSALIEGVYTFVLTVTDDKGVKGSDLVTVTVFPAANIPPSANAGTNILIILPTSSTALPGSGTDTDGTISSYFWEQVNGPSTAAFSDATAQSPTVSTLTNGIYIFSLTVTDNEGAKGTDQVQVTVQPEPPNQPPIVNAGIDVTLTLPANQTTLTGSATDADGTIATYHWNLLSGPPTITLSDVDQAVLDVSNLVAGTYSFELVVADNRGATITDEVKVFVNAQNLPPLVNAGVDKNITLPVSSVTLTGTSSDPDGTIADPLWEQVSGPNTAFIGSETTNATLVSGLIQGIYVFKITVTDDDNVSTTDDVRVTVNPAPPNTPPVANAGPDREITLPVNSVSITGSGTDANGTIVSYLWSQVGGPSTATHTSFALASITWSNLVAGTYIFRLTVTDNGGAKGQKDVNVKVNPQPANIPPVADAGDDAEITLPVSSVSLAGSGSDTDGSITTYLWQQIEGPFPATFTASGNAATDAQDLVEGIYVFRLNVTDDDGVSSFDEVKITVRPIPANLPPLADADDNIVITLPETTAALDGSGSDTDGTITDYNWVQISGPSTATTSDPTQSSLSLSDLVEGIYLFRLTVTDDKGSTGFDEVNIRVQPVPANQPPTASIGTNQIITLPDDAATFNGSGTDPDGTISLFAWTQVSGPSTAPLSGAATPVLTATTLVEGTYIFRLTVTDDEGAQGFDEGNVRVNPTPPNVPPLTDAGVPIDITLPIASTPLDGTASTDPDGSISVYDWTQVSGPSTATFGGNGTATPTASGLVHGIYIFRLTATDDDGESSFDDVQVTVNPEPLNTPPTASAGEDQLITAPPFGLTLTGTAGDSDGPAPTVEWTQISGPSTATLTNETSLTVTVGALQAGAYIFRITATDDDGDTGADEVLVTVNLNQSPVAFAGGSVNIVLPSDTTTLRGVGADGDGSVDTYVWSQVSGPNTPTTQPTGNPNELALDGLIEGQYVFTLTVTDNLGASDDDQITIVVSTAPTNQPPVAAAGSDAGVILPNNFITLSGLASTDADGTIADFAWEYTGTLTATLSDTTFAELLVSDLEEGTYTFSLTVTDDDGATNTDQVTVVVSSATANQPPVAVAGGDAIVTLPNNSITLSGLASTDADGTITAFAWEYTGPLTATLSDTTLAELMVSDLEEGTYTFSLTVTDDDGATNMDQITVTVMTAENITRIPKVFTPNGDAFSPTWIWPEAVRIRYEGCELSVYSRFGKKVFEMVSYDNSWDGTLKGTKLEDDAYYYVIKCSDREQTTGGVRIVR